MNTFGTAVPGPASGHRASRGPLTASTDRPSSARTGARRMLLPIVAVAVAVAVVALAMIVLLASSGTPARGTSGSNDGSIPYPEVLSGQSVPTDEDVLSYTERACQLARVAGC